MTRQATLSCLLALLGAGCMTTTEQQLTDQGDGGAGTSSDDRRESADEMVALTANAIDTPVLATDGASPSIGTGRNSITGEYRGQCVTSNKKYGSAGDATASFNKAITAADASTSFGISGSAKASFGLFGGSARSSFTRTMQSSSRSINVLYKTYITMNKEQLDEASLEWLVAKNDPQWFSRCADTFVQEIQPGGELYLLMRIDFATEAEKQAFEASGSASYLTASGSIDVTKASKSFRGRATIHLEAYQRGGLTQNIGHVFGTGTKVTDGPRGAIECSFDNPTACNDFMATAMRYATGEFSSGLTNNPAALSYTLRDWMLLGAGTSTQPVPQAVTDARNWFLLLYTANVDVLNRWDALNRGGFYGAPQSFRDGAALYAWAAASNVNLIQSGVQKCFDALSNPPTTAQINACTGALSSLTANGYTDVSGAIAAMDVKLPRHTEQGRSDFVGYAHPGSGFWGSWSAYSMCPAGMFVSGYRLRIEDWQGDGDDTGLNAIELTCSTWDRKSSVTRTPHPGNWGTWYPQAACTHGPMNGMRLDVENALGSGSDDTAADRIVGSCVSGQQVEAPYNTKVASWGATQTWDYCPPGSAVCGASVRVEAPQGSGDDTAMNGIALACCAY